jgi:hypothetical protein
MSYGPLDLKLERSPLPLRKEGNGKVFLFAKGD